MAVRISTKHQVTIPRRVVEELGLEVGEYLDAFVDKGRIVFVRRQLVDRDQAYFWTPEWQAGEREASEEIAQGLTKTYESVDDLVSDLQSEQSGR